MKIKLFWIFLILMGAVSLIGCTSDTPTTQPPPSSSPEATHTPSATATPDPTHTPIPTVEPTPGGQTKTGFKIMATATTPDGSLSGEIYILDYYAIEMDIVSQEAVAIYDFLQKSWQEVSTGEFIRMATCMEWANESANLARESLATSNNEWLNQFTESLLTPNFQVEMADTGSIILHNEFLTYEVIPSTPLDEALLNDLYAYDQLNACRKAMIQGQLPPFAQLAVTEELMDRSLFPAEIIITVTTQDGEVELRTTNVIVEMTESEYALAQSILDN